MFLDSQIQVSIYTNVYFFSLVNNNHVQVLQDLRNVLIEPAHALWWSKKLEWFSAHLNPSILHYFRCFFANLSWLQYFFFPNLTNDRVRLHISRKTLFFFFFVHIKIYCRMLDTLGICHFSFTICRDIIDESG